MFDNCEKTICGGHPNTTNNKMELTAVVQALKLLDVTYFIDLYTDSVYVKTGITLWIEKWKINGWKTVDKVPVKNLELWLELDKVVKCHEITWYWVKAHSGELIMKKQICLHVVRLLNRFFIFSSVLCVI